MGYFANGTQGDMYENKYCFKCLNFDEEMGCPVINLHLHWNYEQFNSVGITKKEALDWFIPLDKDGIFNDRCKMFKDNTVNTKK